MHVPGFCHLGHYIFAWQRRRRDSEMVIEDTTFINNATGLLIRPAGGFAANVALRRIKLDKNTGGGLSIDGTAAAARSCTCSPTVPLA